MLLPFPNLLAHFLISTSVKGLVSLVGLTLLKGFILSTVNRDSKNVVIISVFCSESVTISSLLLCTITLFFSFLFSALIASYCFLA